ncbi:hypothetical protein GCM10022257_20240 [Hyunsoonleella aestuarii]|uniref:Uncharacterized protein n=2 Tax=Hyunsoonleella aestuarii TaxID=912802 RepID=A0ABP8ECI2_9FLAO
MKMETKQTKVKYKAWLSAETMHDNTRKWMSELKFAKDEILFFNDLVKSYTLQLIDSKHFAESKKIIDKLNILKKDTDNLINTVKNHEKGLKVMVDGVNELQKEDTYRRKHAKLIIVVSNFLEKYRILKTQLFSLITGVIKEGKQKRLLQ